MKAYLVLFVALLLTPLCRAQSTTKISVGYLYKVDFAIPGKTVYICGQRPFDTSGNLVGTGDLNAQIKQAFENIKTSLATVSMTLRDVVEVKYAIKDSPTAVLGPVNAVKANAIQSIAAAYVPAAQIVDIKNVPQTIRDDVFVEIEVIAVK